MGRRYKCGNMVESEARCRFRGVDDEPDVLCDINDSRCPLMYDGEPNECLGAEESEVLDVCEIVRGNKGYLMRAGVGTLFSEQWDLEPWDGKRSEAENIRPYYEHGLMVCADYIKFLENEGKEMASRIKALEAENARLAAEIVELAGGRRPGDGEAA